MPVRRRRRSWRRGPLARQKGLRFEVDAPAEAPFVTEVNKLRQILFNLLGNAVKFTARGEVRLTLRVAAERAVFEVRDTGSGIPPDAMERSGRRTVLG